jgi:hypothetical protein
VPPTPGEISFQLRLVPTGNRATQQFVVGLSVGLDVHLEMVFQPAMLRSSISARVRDDLIGRGIIKPRSGSRIVLSDLRIDRQPVPDLEVRVGLTAAVFDLDGILGADFLRPFSSMHVDLRTWRVRLSQ